MSAVSTETTRASASASARRWAVALMAASGFAALGYQIVWTQQSTLWLGHETASILAVIAAFFGGIAIGAFALGGRIDRSARPAAWYAACEVTIAAWALVLAALMSPVAHALLSVIGEQPSALRHWSIAFVGTFLLLLPATAAMGATLPAMERMLADVRRDGRSIALLYAGNTFGAVIGVLAAAFVLAPTLGFTRTAALCAILNVACAIGALVLFPKTAAPLRDSPNVRSAPHLSILAATGLLGIGYEVLVVRVLSQIAENTVYTFALLLAVYLVGTALGAAWYASWRVDSSSRPARDRLLQLQAFTCLLGIVALAFADTIERVTINVLGTSMLAALTAEATIAIAAFLLPTIGMGALFSHLTTHARSAGVRFGRALGVNTFGAALAPLIFGVIVSPLLGPLVALMSVAIGYLLLVSSQSWRERSQWIVGAMATAVAIWAPSLAFVHVPPDGRLVRYAEGASATVSIVEDRSGVRTLHINNRQQEGSSATLLADARQALLPILLHPSPRRALFLGLGTGMTARSAAEDPQLRVDVVELVPEVIDASTQFAAPFDAANGSRIRILAADSRRFVRTARKHYDVIVADNFHPARSGSGALYTTQHFAAVRERLMLDGLFCQWLPLHQLDIDTLRSIVRSFLHEYPHAAAILATNSLDTPVVGLIARNDDKPFDVNRIRDRLAGVQLPRALAEFGIVDDLALFGSFIAGSSSLAQFAAFAPLNTDDHPIVMYQAPRITYAPNSAPRDRLIALLGELRIDPKDVVSDSTDASWTQRLGAYLQARDRYLEVGSSVQATSDVRTMLAQVRDPLLDVLYISPDFRPAYDPLLQMAASLARIDPASAQELLSKLDTIQPARPEAAQMLRELRTTQTTLPR